MNDLIQDFVAETQETLELIQGELVAWEADPADAGRLEGIFRFFHTVKGSCGFLDLPRLTRLSHAAEDVLDLVRRGERRPDAALVDAVLAIADRIGRVVDAMGSGEAVDDSDDARLIAALLPGAGQVTQAPAPVPPVAANDGSAARGRSWTVRVPIHLLDQLMNGVSDLVLARNELARQLRGGDTGSEADTAFEQLSAHVGQLREAVGGMRMQRIDRLFGLLPRLMRDIGSELGKDIRIELIGGDVEIDREMIDLVRDPLTHLLRNAADHGIERAADRLAAGKPPFGRIAVSARQVGNHVVIEVADDGRGIDVDQIVARAIASRMASAADIRAMDAQARLDLILRPGFTTASAVSAISGRGVGMDVVKTRIESVGGSLSIANAPGHGLTVTLRVPLTLSIITGLIVCGGGQQFALSQSAVEEIVALHSPLVRTREAAGASAIELRGRLLPHVRIEDVLGLPVTGAPASRSIVVLRAGMGGRFALEVADVLDSEELVVKPAVPAVSACGLYAGMSLPDSGRPMLLIDATGVASVMELAHELDPPVPPRAQLPEAEPDKVLLFESFDGRRRAIRLAVVERMDEVARERIQQSEGLWRLLDGTRFGVVLGFDSLPATAKIRLLRLADGDSLRFLAIAEVLDVVAIDSPIEPPRAPGPVEGLIAIGDEQVELVDPFWLFEQGRPAAAPEVRRRRCHIVAAPHDGWSRTVLRPLLARSGYDVSCSPETDGAADVLVAPEGVPVGAGSAPVVRLGAAMRPGEIAVERHDRAALLAALAGAAA